ADISAYCRRVGMAESTFGRHAVNDGKLVQRLREGGRITVDTLERIRAYLQDQGAPPHASAPLEEFAARPPAPRRDPQSNFRFFDNRQKYLLFVNTCSEKRVVAARAALELASI